MRFFLLIVFSVLPFLTSLVYFLPTAPAPGFMILLGATKAFLFVCPILFWSYLKLPGSWKDFSKLIKSPNISRQLVVGVIIGALMSAVVGITYFSLSPETLNPALLRIAQKIAVLNIREHFLLYGIVLSFVHSLLEEFYWRFFIFNGWKQSLNKKSTHPLPHFLAGLAFTLHHFTVTVHYFGLVFGLILGLGVWAAALVWSYTYQKERSLLGVWISHIVIDLALIAIGFRALAMTLPN